jgi:hypothetical protein
VFEALVEAGTEPAETEGIFEMNEQTIERTVRCDTQSRVTKSLLGYGVLAGPFYVVVSLAQALTRDGFDLTRHQWSLLSTGSLGFIQIINFVLTGGMTIAGAVGLRRALSPGVASTWGPRLVGVFGASLVGAGIFRADPALGFPPGTPDGPGTVSWHGLLHFVCAGIGFACVAAACLVIARRFAVDARSGLALFSRVTGVTFLAGFAAVASGAGATWANLAFVAAVLLVWTWLSIVSADAYRRI